MLFAQNKCASDFLCPDGLSTNGYSTSYLLDGSSAYVKYKSPAITVSVPDSFPLKMEIPYNKLLLSGLKSMLFEYKNYKGHVTSVSYTLFGLGNYSEMNETILSAINKNIFPNQNVLLAIYEWIKPHYIKVFKELTFNEQKLLFDKLQLADQYINLVIKDNNERKFQKWLRENGINDDPTLTSFFKRRISKRQWSVQDCLTWIKRIKNDFPALKDKNKPASHFQVTEHINANLKVACNDVGFYFLIDSGYNKLSDQYVFIASDNKESFSLYPTPNLNDNYKFYIDDDGALIKPIDSSWKDWSFLNDTIVRFEKKKVSDTGAKGLYNTRIQREVMSGYENIFPIESANALVALKADESIGKIYNYQGNFFINEDLEIELLSLIDINTERTVYTIPVTLINDNKWMIIRNQLGKYGLSQVDGKLLLPFNYYDISFYQEKNQIITKTSEDAPQQVYRIVNGVIEIK